MTCMYTQEGKKSKRVYTKAQQSPNSSFLLFLLSLDWGVGPLPSTRAPPIHHMNTNGLPCLKDTIEPSCGGRIGLALPENRRRALSFHVCRCVW